MYITDSNTKSLSEYLIDNNINNYNWFQKLDNDKLANVDPYDENLSDEYKILIIEECKSNPIYFFRNVLRLNYISPPNKQNEIVNFKLTKNVIAKIYLELYRNTSVMELDPRQSYKTITSLAIIIYKYIFSKDESMYIISYHSTSIYDINIIERLISSLPEYIRSMVYKFKYNDKNLYNNYNNNLIDIIPVEYSSHKFSNYHEKKKYYSYLYKEIKHKPTHILFDDLSYRPDFKYVYEAFKLLIDIHNPIVDISSCAYRTEFIRDKWKSLLHWNEIYYDTTTLYSKMILLHYEPDDLFDKLSILNILKSLCHNIDDISKEEMNIFRNEMSIRPFDSHFRIRTYLKKLGIKI